MKILFTGASSFTGSWFVRELSRAGHDVVAVFQGAKTEYDEIRGERVRDVQEHCTAFFGNGIPSVYQRGIGESAGD